MHGEHIQQQPRSRTYLGAVIAAFVVLIVSLALIFTFNPARALVHASACGNKRREASEEGAQQKE